MKKPMFLILVFAGILIISCNNPKTVQDIDSNVYKTVKIGNQTWMAENLKVTKYNDGEVIPNVTDIAWALLTTPGYCWYNNDISNKNIYGALYNWYTVNTGKLCPSGWHVPSDAEWKELKDYLGYEAGSKLKETDTTHWNSPNTGATNETGFLALPGGIRSFSFHSIGLMGLWWSVTAKDTAQAWSYAIHNNLFRTENYVESGLSVRCIKD
jgi:uncharacterized protein (TIGR02145 family)